MIRMRIQRTLLFMALASTCAAQSPKSITYLRLSRQIVDQALQTSTLAENWSAALRKRYIKAGMPPSQIVEQTVPGSDQRMVICTIAGRGDAVIVVSASLARSNVDDADLVAWGSIAMLPLLSESINGVGTDSTIILIGFPGDERHRYGSSWYVDQLSEAQRKKIKAAIEIVDVGRGRTTFETKRGDKYLADWLATAALALRVPVPMKIDEDDSVNIRDSKSFQSAAIPAIAISSEPQRVRPSFSTVYLPVNKLYLDWYYSTYELLCVFLLDIDRVARGASPKSSIGAITQLPGVTAGSVFTEEQVERIIAGQINLTRAEHAVKSLRVIVMPELHSLVCDMAQNKQTDASTFESLLKQKRLSGAVAVFKGSYPNLLPEQLQGLKVGRFDKLSVAACNTQSADSSGPTYWIAALVYE